VLEVEPTGQRGGQNVTEVEQLTLRV